MQIRNIRSQDQAGELSEVKGSLKLSSSVVTQELLRTGYLMLSEVDFIVALETTPPNFPKPSSTCLPALRTQKYLPWCVSGGQSRRCPLQSPSQPELCKNETAGPGQRPNPDTKRI